MRDVNYVEAGAESLDLIRPLWEQLNEYHAERSDNFRDMYRRRTFEERKAELLKKGRLHIFLAVEDCHPIGYCVCSCSGDEGEIDSIFVEEQHRRSGIGEELMRKGLSWLSAQGAMRTIVAVAAGNEAAIPFYATFGFIPRLTILEKVGHGHHGGPGG